MDIEILFCVVRKVLYEDDFLRLLKTEENKLYRTALAILGNEQDAWDSLQQTIEKAWKKRNTLNGGPNAFPAWIKKILLNQSLNMLKAQHRLIPTDPQAMSEFFSLPITKNEQDIRLIWELVQELGPEHRKVIVLRYLGDLSLIEIASELDIPLGTVKSRLNTAHTRLRQKLLEKPEGENNSGFKVT